MIHTKGRMVLVFFLTALLLTTGCATTKKIAEDITGKGGRLKKKMAFLPAVYNTSSQDGVFPQIDGLRLKSLLEDSCEDLIILDSQKGDDLLSQIPRLSSGDVDNLALIETGRALGLNAILVESPSEIECLADKCGIWGFRHGCTFAELSVGLRAYDIETGAVLFYEVLRDKIEVSEQACQDIREGKGGQLDLAAQLVDKITSETCEKVCDRLGAEPWKGYLTPVAENTFSLPAGIDVGLSEGDVLEVFGASEPILGYAGQSYLVAGRKIGELRVTRVFLTHAEAVGDLGDTSQQNNYVKLKR